MPRPPRARPPSHANRPAASRHRGAPTPQLNCPHRGRRATLRHAPAPRSIVAGRVLDRRVLRRAGPHEPAAFRFRPQLQHGVDERRRDLEIQHVFRRLGRGAPRASPSPSNPRPSRRRSSDRHPPRPSHRHVRQGAEREVPRCPAAVSAPPAAPPDEASPPAPRCGSPPARPSPDRSTPAAPPASGPRSSVLDRARHLAVLQPPTRSTASASPGPRRARRRAPPPRPSPTRRPRTSASRSSPCSLRPPRRAVGGDIHGNPPARGPAQRGRERQRRHRYRQRTRQPAPVRRADRGVGPAVRRRPKQHHHIPRRSRPHRGDPALVLHPPRAAPRPASVARRQRLVLSFRYGRRPGKFSLNSSPKLNSTPGRPARPARRGTPRHAAVSGGRSTAALAALVSASPWLPSSVKLAPPP